MTNRSRRPLRKLVLGSSTYLWTVKHSHNVLPAPQAGDSRCGRCREVFTAYLEGRKRSPLQVVFADSADLNAGYPEAGVVWTGDDRVNLNLPSIARRLIEIGRGAGWVPEEMTTPLQLDGATLWVELCKVHPTSSP